METISIHKNINLHYIPMPNLKTTTIGIFIHRELKAEEASLNALLPYVLKRGCRLCKNAEEVSKYLENLYGASMGAGVFKKGEDQLICLNTETIANEYAPEGEPLMEDLLELLLSVVFEPVVKDGAFLEETVQQEKSNAKNRIQALMNDKRTYAMIRCTEEMCKQEAFGISQLGTIEGIEKITAKSLWEYYQKMITSSVIDLYICGTAQIQSMAGKIKECISRFDFLDAQIPQTQILKKTQQSPEMVEEILDVAQGKLSMGFRTNAQVASKDYPALQVFNSIFGSGTHSKLFNNVREKLSLAYYASSQLEAMKGLMLVNAGIEFDKFQQAHDEILTQLKEIQQGNITQAEFDSSIQSLVNAYNSIYDEPHQLQVFYLGQKIVGAEQDIETVKEKLKAVTKEEVVQVAQNIVLDTVYFLKGKEGK